MTNQLEGKKIEISLGEDLSIIERNIDLQKKLNGEIITSRDSVNEFVVKLSVPVSINGKQYDIVGVSNRYKGQKIISILNKELVAVFYFTKEAYEGLKSFEKLTSYEGFIGTINIIK